MAIQQFTVRSISLPSRLHPNGLKIEAELNNFKQWEASSSIEAGLVDLAELYNSTREALESSSTQAALLHHQSGILVEESLDGSIELLDSCGAIKDLFSTMKEHVQELQSAMRRKNGGSSLVASDINTFISCRRRVKKEAAKILRKLKHMESKVVPCLSLDMDHNLASAVKMLGEVSAITISILRSLLVFLSNSSGSSSTSRWSLISKMITAKSQKGNALNDLGFVDLALASLHGSIKMNGDSKNEAQMVRTQLQILDGRVEGLEAGLECLFRQLVRHRVTFLNMLTH